jgi:hypothetical protein
MFGIGLPFPNACGSYAFDQQTPCHSSIRGKTMRKQQGKIRIKAIAEYQGAPFGDICSS